MNIKSLYSLIPVILLFSTIGECQELSQNEKDFNYPSFSQCGFISKYSPALIPPECLQTARNVLFDEDLSVTRRNGYIKYNTASLPSTIRGMWNFDAIDGSSYMVVESSNSLYYTTNGNFTIIPTTISFNSSNNLKCVQSLGYLWCTDSIDPLISWDGATLISHDSAPKAKLIGSYRNRILLGDITGEKSRLLLSGDGDGSDWTLFIPGVSTSPASIDISGMNDGDGITCLMGQYQNSYIIGRKNDLWALYGNDRTDFSLAQISNEIGCKEPGSVREKNNCLIWMSNRGIEQYCGSTINRISDGIRDQIDNIITAAGNGLSRSFDTSGDWGAGAARSVYTSTTIYPGSVVPSTAQYLATQGADWAAGTLTNIDTFTVPGTIGINLSSATEVFDDFNNELNFSNPLWTIQSGNWTTFNHHAEMTGQGTGAIANSTFTWTGGALSFSMHQSGADYLQLNTFNQDNNLFFETNTGTWGTRVYFSSNYGTYDICDSSIAPPAGFVANVYISLLPNSGWVVNTNYGVSCTSAAPSYTYNGRSTTNTGIQLRKVSGSGYDPYWDDIKITHNIGTWISHVFDTSFSTPTGGIFEFSDTTPMTSTVAYSVRGSTYNAGVVSAPWNLVSTTTSAAYRIPLDGDRYWQTKADLSTQYSTQTPTVNSLDLNAVSTGYYITDCVNTAGASAWGNFRTNSSSLGQGKMSFFVSSGTSCANVTTSTANWQSINDNAQISIDTSNYLGTKTVFYVGSSTDIASLNAMTVEWTAGSNRPPVTAEVYNNRYYMFYSTNTSGTGNDSALILDKNSKWLLFNDIYSQSSLLYNNYLYTGSSKDGYIYQQDISDSDDGNNFDLDIRTNDYDFGNPTQNKLLKRVYVYLKTQTNTLTPIDLSLKYYVNGSTTAYSMGAVSLLGNSGSQYFVAKFPVPANMNNTFNWLSFELAYTGDKGPLEIYGIKVVYEPINWL